MNRPQNILRALPFALLLCWLAGTAVAQQAGEVTPPPEPAVLVADSVEVTRDRVLVARGNVQVFQGDVSLTATAITYDRNSGQLLLEGPLRLQDGTGIILVADAAELDPGLRNGILLSARMVLDQQLQLAAAQINRIDARYSQLYKAAVTSCKVCEDGRPPLWQIRAKRVVHDQQEQQLYFDNATLWVRKVPIFYIPRLRLPDPTLERATGFLIPSIRTTSQLATGVKLPYFIRLGDHRDLTLTPYISARTRTLELRYRQAYRRGRINFHGAITRDDLLVDQDRFYLFGTGEFDLARDFQLDFDVEITSDDAYLRQYDYSGKDLLDSEIALSRTRRDEYTRLSLIGYHNIRSGEDNSTTPSVVVDGLFERRLFPKFLGGELRLALAAHGHQRSSSSTVSGEGRDLTRVHGEAHWLNTFTLGAGLQVETSFGVAFDATDTRQDATFAGTESQMIPQAALTLRYPMSKISSRGAVHYLEPVIQVGWTGEGQLATANDESTRNEFDEGNLFALSRFAERDRREYGRVIAWGVNWARYDPAGWESFLTLGQVVRQTANADFTRTSGLGGTTSDYLLAAQLKSQDGLSLAGRMIFDETLDFAKAEIRSDWSTDKLTVGGSYLWLVKDAAESRTKAVSELTLDGDLRFDRHWTLSGNWRYDLEDDRTARAGLGLGYDNECVSVALSADRVFTSSTSVEPSTSFGFTISLRGFSAQNGTESFSRSCS